MSQAHAIQAAVFDVFGTVVDWRGSLIREGQALQAATGTQADWSAFADAWRAGYAPAMDRTRGQPDAWANIDTLHRQILEEIIPRFGLQALSEAQRVQLNLAWHRLQPWPDAVAGLQRLKRLFPIATLSNGNVRLLVNMARQGGLPWDAVFSGELVRRYKPDPEVYLAAARWMDVPPQALLMVAAHPSDLRAAAQCGLRTAYVHRPAEFGLEVPRERPEPGAFDWMAEDFGHLAQQLGG